MKRFFWFILSLASFSAIAGHANTLSVKGDNVHVRTGPGKNYDIKSEYGSGFPVQVVEKNGNWVKVKDFENDTGWLYESLLVDSSHVIVKANKNKDEKINIRKGPSANSEVVGKAYYGVVFRVVRKKSGWVEVQHESGLTGWINSGLLWGI